MDKESNDKEYQTREQLYSKQFAEYLESCDALFNPEDRVQDVEQYSLGLDSLEERLDLYMGYIRFTESCNLKHSIIPLESDKHQLEICKTQIKLIEKEEDISKIEELFGAHFPSIPIVEMDYKNCKTDKEKKECIILNGNKIISNLKDKIALSKVDNHSSEYEIIFAEKNIKRINEQINSKKARSLVEIPFTNQHAIDVFNYFEQWYKDKTDSRYSYIFKFFKEQEIDTLLKERYYFDWVFNEPEGNRRVTGTAISPRKYGELQECYHNFLREQDS